MPRRSPDPSVTVPCIPHRGTSASWVTGTLAYVRSHLRGSNRGRRLSYAISHRRQRVGGNGLSTGARSVGVYISVDLVINYSETIWKRPCRCASPSPKASSMHHHKSVFGTEIDQSTPKHTVCRRRTHNHPKSVWVHHEENGSFRPENSGPIKAPKQRSTKPEC